MYEKDQVTLTRQPRE